MIHDRQICARVLETWDWHGISAGSQIRADKLLLIIRDTSLNLFYCSPPVLSMLFHGLLFAVSPAIASVVDLGYAKYEGEQIGAGHLEAFGPIRYAAKPERWALPTEPLPEGGEVKKRSAFTPSCHGVGARHLSNKAPSTWTPGGGDEDCLFLKLWKPVGDVQDLPVIVHIHGGGYQEGETSFVNMCIGAKAD